MPNGRHQKKQAQRIQACEWWMHAHLGWGRGGFRLFLCTSTWVQRLDRLFGWLSCQSRALGRVSAGPLHDALQSEADFKRPWSPRGVCGGKDGLERKGEERKGNEGKGNEGKGREREATRVCAATHLSNYLARPNIILAHAPLLVVLMLTKPKALARPPPLRCPAPRRCPRQGWASCCIFSTPVPVDGGPGAWRRCAAPLLRWGIWPVREGSGRRRTRGDPLDLDGSAG
jgi:hypothetical protein